MTSATTETEADALATAPKPKKPTKTPKSRKRKGVQLVWASSECALCGHQWTRCQEPEGDTAPRIALCDPGDRPDRALGKCEFCAEVYRRAPEVYDWVRRVVFKHENSGSLHPGATR